MIVLKFISFIVRLLPLGVALKIGDWLGMLVWWLFPSRRKITADNLKKAFAHIKTNRQLHKIAQGMAKNMGKNLMEFFRLPALSKDNIENYIEFNGLEHLENALRLKRGVFILTAHLGNWDLVAAACVLKGYRVNVVTKHLKISLFNKFWLDYRARMNINQIYREGSLREIINALKRNELMGFILDQHAKSSDGILIDFFNRPAWTTPSLAVLAQRYNAPVVPCFIVRQNDGRHKIIFEPDIPFREMPTPEETIRYNTQIYTDVIERYIRAYPEQWIWMHRRWKTKGI
ncbi:MAG: lysophospholipid acyltransferase family protein [Planctomycetota bacterium]